MFRLIATPLVITAGLLSFSAFGQQYPDRPIKLVVPYPAGQGADVVARRLVVKIGPLISQPIVIENRGGAGGNIGTDVVAKSKPDGYTLVVGTTATHAANQFLYDNIPYNAATDFTPIVSVVSYGVVLAVHANSPFKTLQDLVTAAKQKPKSLEAAIPSTTSRLVLEALRSAAGTDILPVPYVGTPAALTDSISGRVAMNIDTSSALLGNLKAGTLRPLAVATDKRMDTFPNLPTFREQGFDVVVTPGNGLFGPKGIPAQTVQVLNAAVNKAFSDRELYDTFVAEGAQPLGGKPDDLDRMMRSERIKWEAVVKATGMKAQ